MRALYGGVLAGLLTALLIGVLTFDRQSWPALVGDEATYLMAAESLAWDFDLRYERQDYDRFLEHWQLAPEGLILQGGSDGDKVTFGKPFFYSLWVAPFSRLSPSRGPFLANWLALLVAAVLASRTLEQTVGAAAPLWVAISLFASVAFAYAFWGHADLFLLALTASALSLAFWRAEGEGGVGADRGWALRWSLVGLLLTMVVFSRPFYLPLFLPAVLALPRDRRWQSGLALALSSLVLASAAAMVHRGHGEAWTSYGGERRGFYSSTGFPAVDFPLEQWREGGGNRANVAWFEAATPTRLPRTHPTLWSWNSLYFLVGRSVGVLPYFLPILLGLFGRPRGAARWSLLVAVALSVAGFFLYRPFNFYGGGGALANRYFLPLYPAFWFMATRPCRPRRLLAVVLLAAPFLWPLWREARSFPQRQNHTWRYVSKAAIGLLPFETTQSHLKPAGRSDLVHGTLWVKFLTPTLRGNRAGTGLLLDRGSRGALLIASQEPLEALRLQTLGDPQERLRVTGGATVLDDSETAGGRSLRMALGGIRARHSMWWSWRPLYLYELSLESDSESEGRLTFRLTPERQATGEES